MTPQNIPNETLSNQTLDQMNQIEQITRWFEAVLPKPTDRNVHTQLGVHFEEVGEIARTLTEASDGFESRKQLTFAADVLNYFQRQLKSGDLRIDLDKIDRTALLDSLCDQIVTAVGIAHMLGMDIEGALGEVAALNDSKFGEGGQPIFNSQRKIMKGPHYKSPNLTAFTIRE